MDERVRLGRREQTGEQRAANVGLEVLGPLELGERRRRVDAEDLLDPRIPLQAERQLGPPVGSDAGEQYPAAGRPLDAWIRLFIGFQRACLTLY